MTSDAAPTHLSRPKKRPVLRVLLFIVLLVAVYACAWLLLESAENVLPRVVARAVTSVVMLTVFVLLASQVGYRPVLALALFWVPFYGAIFGMKVLWRVANLPDRYWDRKGRGPHQAGASPGLVRPSDVSLGEIYWS